MSSAADLKASGVVKYKEEKFAEAAALFRNAVDLEPEVPVCGTFRKMRRSLVLTRDRNSGLSFIGPLQYAPSSCEEPLQLSIICLFT